ncbi:MAG: hypothetical protein AAF361_15355 [Bacteroidota bacterium]
MEFLKKTSLIGTIVFTLVLISSCREKAAENKEVIAEVKEAKKTIQQLREELLANGYEIFDFVDAESGDTILMQQYFIAFLKSGPNRSQSKEETDSLQELHLAHLGRMYKEGYADISGPFGDNGEIRGITIYSTPTLQMADSLANLDPMVKAGRLVIEVHPWWAAKGYPLR